MPTQTYRIKVYKRPPKDKLAADPVDLGVTRIQSDKPVTSDAVRSQAREAAAAHAGVTTSAISINYAAGKGGGFVAYAEVK